MVYGMNRGYKAKIDLPETSIQGNSSDAQDDSESNDAESVNNVSDSQDNSSSADVEEEKLEGGESESQIDLTAAVQQSQMTLVNQPLDYSESEEGELRSDPRLVPAKKVAKKKRKGKRKGKGKKKKQ